MRERDWVIKQKKFVMSNEDDLRYSMKTFCENISLLQQNISQLLIIKTIINFEFQ